MFVSLKLERIGSDRLGHQPAWVKQVNGITSRGLIEDFVDGTFDYSHANSVGSRGVFIYYLLREGKVYHVSSPRNFKQRDTYFCRIENTQSIEMTFDEVVKYIHKPRRLVDVDTGELVSG